MSAVPGNYAPLVYLDTQDYSRFGDFLRGKCSDPSTGPLFETLIAMKSAGRAVFALSMPIMGELLQYDSAHRETTIKKAEAAELLCGAAALVTPSRVIKAEIAAAASRLGLIPEIAPATLTTDRYWYPNISDVFLEFDEMIGSAVDEQIKGGNRSLRRLAKRQLRRFDMEKVATRAIPEIARKYDLPPTVIKNSVVAYLGKRVDAEQASRLLFGAVAEPVKFVETYFERVETERGLPKWLSGAGGELKRKLEEMKTALAPLTATHSTEQVMAALDQASGRIGQTVVRAALDGTEEFGVTSALIEKFASDSALAGDLTATRIIGRVVIGYLGQVFGAAGSEASIERSFGGDLVHSLYLPHVDLWRGDRRLSAVAQRVLPEFAGTIVPKLAGLPAAIDAWHSNRA